MKYSFAHIGIVIMVFALVAPILCQSVLEGGMPVSDLAKDCFAIALIIGAFILSVTLIPQIKIVCNYKAEREETCSTFRKDR